MEHHSNLHPFLQEEFYPHVVLFVVHPEIVIAKILAEHSAVNIQFVTI